MQGLIEKQFVRSAFAAPDTIMVATDLNDLQCLLPHAIVQAKASRATLAFVHAVVPEETPMEKGATSKLCPLKRDRDARLEMEVIARQVREQGTECSTAVRHGSVVDVIAEIVHQTGAGRLIAGTHARFGVEKLKLGSVLLRLLYDLDVPVCVIGPHAHTESRQPTLRTILHPFSLSEGYEQSAALVLNLAQYSKANLTLMHVFDPDKESQITNDHIACCALDNLVPRDDLCPPILTRETVVMSCRKSCALPMRYTLT